MEKIIARILLLADFHFMAVPVGYQKGQVTGGISRLVEGVINIWKRFNNSNYYRSLMKIKAIGKFDLTVVMGDMIECDYNERGILGYLDKSAAEKVKKSLFQAVPSQEFRFIPGDHELGYILPLSIDPRGGVSIDSVENYHYFVGPLFSQYDVGNFKLIFLSSSLFTQSWRADPEKDLLDYYKAKQMLFLSEVLARIEGGKKVLLFVHDPDCLEKINEVVPAELYQKINKVFCGHMHAEESLEKYKKLGEIANSWISRVISLHPKGKKIMDWARGNLRRHDIFRGYDLTVVPAFGGMLGKGGGFLVLNLLEDGTIEIEKHSA